MLRVLSNVGMQPLESTEHNAVSICSTDSVTCLGSSAQHLWLHEGGCAAGRGSLDGFFAFMHAAWAQVKQ